MRITSLGHAGFLIDTCAGSLVCDPWFVPAFHGSWFPFPRNDRLPDDLMQRLERPDYLYISHQHADHLDVPWLSSHVDKATPVLLPDYATRELHDQLASLGFREFIPTRDGVPQRLPGGLEVEIHVATSMSDGPGGDSALIVDDGTARFLNQNDCHLRDVRVFLAGGPVDVHALQFSGAIWWPMVYDMDPELIAGYAREKREAQAERAVRYAQAIGARLVIPSAGPPAFLDEDLFGFNMITGDESSIFPDQADFMSEYGERLPECTLMVPGSQLTADRARITLYHVSDMSSPFLDKEDYLREYQRDWAPWLAQLKASWPSEESDILGALREWWEPLLDGAPRLRDAIGGSCLIESGQDALLVDFAAGTVRRYAGEPYSYRFTIPRPLLEAVVRQRDVDWSNSLLLSCRFRAWREGDYNEYLYAFLKSLSPERIARAEHEAANVVGSTVAADFVEVGPYTVGRWCPHRQADLAEFGMAEGEDVVCAMHGWRFDGRTGRCRTARGRDLRVPPGMLAGDADRSGPPEPHLADGEWPLRGDREDFADEVAVELRGVVGE